MTAKSRSEVLHFFFFRSVHVGEIFGHPSESCVLPSFEERSRARIKKRKTAAKRNYEGDANVCTAFANGNGKTTE